MDQVEFMRKNLRTKFCEVYPDVGPAMINAATSKAVKHYTQNGNFRGKAFDVCFAEGATVLITKKKKRGK